MPRSTRSRQSNMLCRRTAAQHTAVTSVGSRPSRVPSGRPSVNCNVYIGLQGNSPECDTLEVSRNSFSRTLAKIGWILAKTEAAPRGGGQTNQHRIMSMFGTRIKYDQGRVVDLSSHLRHGSSVGLSTVVRFGGVSTKCVCSLYYQRW